MLKKIGRILRHIFKADGLYIEHAEGGMWANQTFVDRRTFDVLANSIRKSYGIDVHGFHVVYI